MGRVSDKTQTPFVIVEDVTASVVVTAETERGKENRGPVRGEPGPRFIRGGGILGKMCVSKFVVSVDNVTGQSIVSGQKRANGGA